MSDEHYYPHAVHPQFHGYGNMGVPNPPYAGHANTGMSWQAGGAMPTGGNGFGGAPAPYYAQSAYPYAPYQTSSSSSLINDRFLKGLLIGAAATYLITNESVQKTAIKSVVRVWSMIQGGVEEMKERFHDAEAEIQAAEAAKE